MFEPTDPYGRPDKSDEARGGYGVMLLIVGGVLSLALQNPIPMLAAVGIFVIKGF